MKSLLPLVAGLALFAPTLVAQTTGVPAVNDLRVLLPPLYVPAGSGLTSCAAGTNQGFIPGAPFVVAYELSAVTSTGAVLLLDFFNPCNSPGIPFFPVQAATCAGPVAGGTNLWYSLGFVPAPVPVFGVTNTTGVARWNFSVPAGPATVWAQAVILDACSTWGGLKFSQALGFSW